MSTDDDADDMVAVAEPILTAARDEMAAAGIDRAAVPHCLVACGLSVFEAQACCKPHLIQQLANVRDIIGTKIEMARAGVGDVH